ncbi:CE170 protein, partial [Amia calva]|nr:CE170 protein [Amia calva]
MSLTSWFLVSSGGTRHRLPREMIFVGRDDCELMLQSRSVDKQHAVINYEAATDEHKVKDLGSLNGTFVNDIRIQEQMYITLKMDDKLRVLECAFSLHEKFTSQLQLTKKPSEGETSKVPPTKVVEPKAAEACCEGSPKLADPYKLDEKLAGDIAAMHRGTPLYGQPSWWGDGDADDENSFKQETKTASKKQESSLSEQKIDPYLKKKVKVTIKDHVTKFTPDHRPRPKKSPQQGGKELSTLQAAMIAAESKVADWLAQNDPPMARRESTEEDSKSIKSDVPVHLKRLKGSKHEDGTQSDSENGAGHRFTSRRVALEERLRIAQHGRPKGSVPTDCKGAPSPLAVPTPARLLVHQKSDDSSVVRSSASVGQQTSPTEMDKATGTGDKDNEDDHSDKGTYTIEMENPNPEEAEARRMIDKVFGVEESPDHSRPVVPEQQQEGLKEWQTTGSGEQRKPGFIDSEILPEDTVAVGSPRWVSQWASLAANHTGTEQDDMRSESPAFLVHEKEADVSESGISMKSAASATSASSHGERKRRTLPQLPTEDKALDSQRAKPVKTSTGLGLRSEIGEKQDTEPQEKESQSSTKGRESDRASRAAHKAANATQAATEIERADLGTEEDKRRRPDDSPRSQSGRGGDSEKSGKPLVRQGSFTIEKPSANVPQELIPRINKQMGSSPLARERSDSVGSVDTTLLLKDTEAVMAFLEAKLREENKLDGGGGADPPSYPLEDSISPESDVDTASTISLVTGEVDRKSAQKRRTLSSLHKEKSTVSSAAKSAASARERLEKKTKPRPSEGRPDSRRSAHASSRVRQPSLDLTDDDQTSSLPHSTISDVFSSDQETYSGRSHGRGQFTSTDELLHSKLEASKAGKTKTPQPPSQIAGKPATLPRPRPTRASLLRRARLGETSDNDLADADKVSVASEVSTTSSTSKPPSGRKTPSRIDMLAQPRRTRLGSLSARSDSEAPMSRSSTSSRAPDSMLRLGLRTASTADAKVMPRMRANSVSKLPDTKAKISSVHSSPSANARWRRLPPEYASTSEDEFGSNRNSPKHARLRAVTPAPGGVVLKHRMREQEEYIRDWTAHSEEIARISQDLAKDLAILAREIHDVAGEIDSVSSSGTAPSTTVSTAATTPGSAIDTREELVDRVFDESLNFRKIPPVVQNKAPEINGRPVELRPRSSDAPDPQAAIRRRTWNRDEAVLDSLLLTSVAQLSSKIRQSVDKTAGKIRILFKDKDRNWDEIENKLRAESDMPLLKTSNKEISSILQELKRVEKQLQVINVMVDPDGTLDALSSLGLTSPILPKQRSSPSSQGPRSVASSQGGARASSEQDSMPSERDFSLHFKRFNAGREEESSLTQE